MATLWLGRRVARAVDCLFTNPESECHELQLGFRGRRLKPTTNQHLQAGSYTVTLTASGAGNQYADANQLHRGNERLRRCWRISLAAQRRRGAFDRVV
jgi:hypothetical protein